MALFKKRTIPTSTLNGFTPCISFVKETFFNSLTVLLFMFFGYVASAQSVLYVDSAASGTSNGLTWANAFTDLQDALDQRMTNANVDTILVASGTYIPTESPDGTSTNFQDYAFHLKDSSVVILGGYNPSTGIKTTTKSILKASVAVNLVSAYHVFMTSDLPATTEINNFMITGGQGETSPLFSLIYDGKGFERYSGGGFTNLNSNITYIDCYFYDNRSSLGGAIHSRSGTDSFYNCVIRKNVAPNYAINGSSTAGAGGGCYFIFGTVYMESCLIDSNSVDGYAYGGSGGTYYVSKTSGGGVIMANCSYTAENCVFDDNLSTSGVAVGTSSSSNVFRNCAFINNDASLSPYAINKPQKGSGIWSVQSYNRVYGCSFIGNNAYEDAAIYCDFQDTLEAVNCLFYDNTEDGGVVSDIGLKSGVNGAFLINSFHNATDVGDTSVLDTGGGFVDLSAAYNKDIFVDSVNHIGADNTWGTDDDGFNLSVSSLLIGKGTALNGLTEDIIGTARNASPCIGAYELDICSETSGTVYVDVNATGVNSGLSWVNAFTDLQDALDLRMSCNNVDTILVAEGTYYPTSAPDETTTDPRKRAFHLASANVAVIGGYDPVSGTKTGDTTFLDGDLVTAGTASDSAVHVLCFALLSSSTTFENLTITNGKANAWVNMFYAGRTFVNHSGGGAIIVNANVKFKNVLLDNNYAASSGGAIYVYNGYPQMENSVVSNNSAVNGGAVAMVNNVNIAFSNTVFYNNTATTGGAFHGHAFTSPSLSNCVFTNNSATGNGGAFYMNLYSSPVYNHVSFVGNSAANGGVAYFDNTSTPTFKNIVSYDNSATSNPEIALLNSSSINSTSTNNASDQGISSSLSGVGSGYTNLSGLHFKDLFKDSTNFKGLDNIWATNDDGLIPIDTAVINQSGSSKFEQDIAGFYRGSSSSMGAYETRACTPSNVLPTKLDSIYSSSIKTTDSLDWSHYCSENGELLLSLYLLTGNAVVNADEVRLKTGPARAFSTTSFGNSFSNTNGYAMIDKRWDVSPSTNNSTGTVGVRYYFTSDDYNDIKVALAAKSTTLDSVQQLQMYKATNGASFSDPHLVNTRVISKGTVADTTNWIYSAHNTTNHSAEFTVKSFSGGGGGALGGGGGTVPVELIEFAARGKEGHKAVLDWTTASEINNSHFIIERSYDGEHYQFVDRVEGNGTTQEVIDYKYIDETIAKENRVVYYRLHQFDYDGESAYSDVRVVELDNLEGVTVNVYPNPAREAIYVRVDAETEEELKIELVNVNGQKLYSNTLTSKESNTRLDLSKYQAGIYFVTVKSAKSNYFYKIVKQ